MQRVADGGKMTKLTWENVTVKLGDLKPWERNPRFSTKAQAQRILDSFEKFGQAYITTAYPGVVKAWHYHKVQVDHFACIAGMIKLVLVDRRDGSPTHGVVNEFFIGTLNPMLVQVPNLVYHGWKCISPATALVVNVPTEPYQHAEPDEFRVEPHGVLPYDWTRRDG